MYPAVSANHPVAAHDTIVPETLNGLTFFTVAQLDEIESRDRIMQRCARIGFTPSSIELLDNFPTLLYMLREKRGVSICGKFSTLVPNDIKYYPLDLGEQNASILVAWYPERLTRQARDFIKMLTK